MPAPERMYIELARMYESKAASEHDSEQRLRLARKADDCYKKAADLACGRDIKKSVSIEYGDYFH